MSDSVEQSCAGLGGGDTSTQHASAMRHGGCVCSSGDMLSV